MVESTSRHRVRDWISETFLFCLRCSPSHRWDPIKLKNIICREASLAFDSHERHRSSFFIIQDSTHKRESILSLSFTNRLLPAVMIRFMETTSDDALATEEEKPGSTGRRLVMALDEGTPRESRERVPSHYETGIDSLSVLPQKLQLQDADPAAGFDLRRFGIRRRSVFYI